MKSYLELPGAETYGGFLFAVHFRVKITWRRAQEAPNYIYQQLIMRNLHEIIFTFYMSR